MSAILKKELRSVLTSFTYWGALAIQALVFAVAILLTNVNGGTAIISVNIQYFAFAEALVALLISYDAYGKERRQHTERLLYLLPVKSGAIFAGKLLARFAAILIGGILMACYPLIMSVLSPSIFAQEGLSAVLAVTLLGLAFTALFMLCSVTTKNTLLSLIACIVCAVIVYFLPLAVNYVAAVKLLSLPAMIILLLLVAVIAYNFTSDIMISLITAAVIEIPLLICYLGHNGAAVFTFASEVLSGLCLFDKLNLFVNSILDISALIIYAAVCLLFSVLGILCAGARRTRKGVL